MLTKDTSKLQTVVLNSYCLTIPRLKCELEQTLQKQRHSWLQLSHGEKVVSGEAAGRDQPGGECVKGNLVDQPATLNRYP